MNSTKKKKKQKSLRGSIMVLCVGLVLLMAVAVGGNAVFSTKTMSAYTINTYEETVNEGYNKEIKSQVQSAISILKGEYEKVQAGEKTE